MRHQRREGLYQFCSLLGGGAQNRRSRLVPVTKTSSIESHHLTGIPCSSAPPRLTKALFIDRVFHFQCLPDGYGKAAILDIFNSIHSHQERACSGMEHIQKTVFLSYRRATNSFSALAIFQDLTQHGYDVFYDFEGIGSGDFEQVIVGNIKARAHFLVLLTPSALERCGARQIGCAARLRLPCLPSAISCVCFWKGLTSAQRKSPISFAVSSPHSATTMD